MATGRTYEGDENMTNIDDFMVRKFDRVVFFTGAGMSAESGVPTYRGKGGIWKQYDFASYACQDAFDRDPDKVWEFHNYRRGLVGACEPNLGHRRIAEVEQRKPGTTVVTQNIDGLHQLAGSSNVVELHGSLWRIRCDACGGRQETREAPLTGLRCACGAYWRPDIVWFGDALVEEVIEKAISAIGQCDLLVSVGTSAVVYPAAQMPLIARKAGAALVEVNPDTTPMSESYDLCLRETASQALEKLCAGVE